MVVPKILPSVKHGVTTSVRNLTNMDSHLNDLVKPSRLSEYVNKSPNLKKTLEHIDKFNKSEIGKFTSSPPKYIVENIGKGELAPLIPATKSALFGTGLVIGTGYGANEIYKNKNSPTGLVDTLVVQPTKNLVNTKADNYLNDKSHLKESFYTIKHQGLPYGGKTKRRKIKRTKRQKN